jgi:hypothetical protein
MMIEPTYRNANQSGLATLIFTVCWSMKQFRVPTLGMPQSSSIDFYQSDTVWGVSSAVKICNALIPPFSFFFVLLLLVAPYLIPSPMSLKILAFALFSTVATALSASGPAEAATAVAAKVPNPEDARPPLPKHPTLKEDKMAKPGPTPCSEEVNQPCETNADCTCSKFCAFGSEGKLTEGACVTYNREQHN